MQPSRPSSRGWGGGERDCRPRAKVYSPPASHSTVARAEKREAQPFRTTTWGQHIPGTKMSPCGREHQPAACIPGGTEAGERGGPSWARPQQSHGGPRRPLLTNSQVHLCGSFMGTLLQIHRASKRELVTQRVRPEGVGAEGPQGRAGQKLRCCCLIAKSRLTFL